MPVPPEILQVGKCYVTAEGQLRRILRFLPGRVQFERRIATAALGHAWVPRVVDCRAFAASVEREVPCDWTPEREG